MAPCPPACLTHFVGCESSLPSTVECYVTSGMIMQLLAGANCINIDFSLNETCVLFSGARKCEYVQYVTQIG